MADPGHYLNPSSWPELFGGPSGDQKLDRPQPGRTGRLAGAYNMLPQSPRVEDRRNEPVPLLEPLNPVINAIADDPWVRALREWLATPQYQMNPLHAPIASGMAADLGANDIMAGDPRYRVGDPRHMGLSAAEQKQFDRGETPGSLPFEINMSKVHSPRSRSGPSEPGPDMRAQSQEQMNQAQSISDFIDAIFGRRGQ